MASIYISNSSKRDRRSPLFTACAGNTPTGSATQGSGFDVSPDAQKFLFVCAKESQNKYVVTVNWQQAK